jgi:hypothetical protein
MPCFSKAAETKPDAFIPELGFRVCQGVAPGAGAAGQQQPARGAEGAARRAHQKSIFWPGSGTSTRVVEAAPSADVNSAGVPRSSGKVP